MCETFKKACKKKTEKRNEKENISKDVPLQNYRRDSSKGIQKQRP